MTLFWKRFNVICAWPLLFLVDAMIAWTTQQAFREVRCDTKRRIAKIWNRPEVKR